MKHNDLDSKHVQLGPIGTIIFGVVLMGIGWLFAFVWAGSSMQAGAESEDWPTVEGVVTTSKLVEDRRPRRKDRLREYAAEVVYTYEVDGQKYESRRVKFHADSEWSQNRSAVKRIVDRYPRGSKVEVFHAPDDPGTSVLEPAVSLGIAFLVGIAAILLGLVVVGGGLYTLFKGPSPSSR